MWILQTLDRPDIEIKPMTFRLGPGAVRTIGRATGANFIVEAPMVSRLHCQLSVGADGQLEVSDLDSTNGTYLNEERVTRAPVREGDRLRVGRVELIVLRDPVR